MDFSFISNIISNTEQSELFDSLNERFEYWNSYNRIGLFYNNLPHRDAIDFATEVFKDGFIIVTSQSIFYDNLSTGDCHSLEKTWDDNSYSLFCQLSESATPVRIDYAADRRIVDIGGTQWMYTKYVAPNKEYGESIMLQPQDAYSVASKFVDEAALIIEKVQSISIHRAPIRMLNPCNWYKDSIGWFWANLYDWSSDLETEKSNGLLYFKMTLDTSLAANKMNSSQVEELLAYAKTKWR